MRFEWQGADVVFNFTCITMLQSGTHFLYQQIFSVTYRFDERVKVYFDTALRFQKLKTSGWQVLA